MKPNLIIKNPWTLFVLALVWAVFRLRAGSLLFVAAIAPILAIAILGSIYESLDDYKITNNKPFWLNIPFANYIEKIPRLSSSQKQVTAILAVLWAFVLSYFAGQSTH